MTGAAFVFERTIIEKGIIDDRGKSRVEVTNGFDFNDINSGDRVLDRLRHLVFHEWTHGMEKEFINVSDRANPKEYMSPNGKVYTNYLEIKEYKSYRKGRELKEPEYILSHKKRNKTREIRVFYCRDEKGRIISENEIDFDLKKEILDTPIRISTGLTTIGKSDRKIHNQITEGFVEATARAILAAVDDRAKIKNDGYYEQTEMAKTVISARDKAQGINGRGQTFADFLMHSSKLRRELQTRVVTMKNGEMTDGLQYLTEYADEVGKGSTNKKFFLSEEFKKIYKHLGLDSQKAREIRRLGIGHTRVLSEKQIDEARTLLMSGRNPDKEYTDKQIKILSTIIAEEDKFFRDIPGKLGYTEKSVNEEDYSKANKKPERIGEKEMFGFLSKAVKKSKIRVSDIRESIKRIVLEVSTMPHGERENDSKDDRD